MSQESASWAIQGLLLTTPPPSQQFCHEVLKHDPELIDLLFKCAAVPREAWYPELQVDSIICEAIVMLFRVPIFCVPGILVSLDYDFQKTTEEEWTAVLDSLKLFMSRPNWAQMILGVWERMEDETPQSIKKYACTASLFSCTGSNHSTLAGYLIKSRAGIMHRVLLTLNHF